LVRGAFFGCETWQKNLTVELILQLLGKLEHFSKLQSMLLSLFQ